MTRLVRNRIDGIAEPLPDGEQILWSAKPEAWQFTRRLMRLEWVVAWFVGLAGLRAYNAWSAGADAMGLIVAASAELPLALFGLGLLTALGVAMARSTTYVVSAQRLVLQVGVALPITFNVPLRFIDDASVRVRPGAGGDVILTLRQGAKVKAIALWPHSQGWNGDAVKPLMRDLSEIALNELKPILAKVLEASQLDTNRTTDRDHLVEMVHSAHPNGFEQSQRVPV